MTLKPFTLIVKNDDGKKVYEIKELLFDKYINYYSATLYTAKGDEFKSIIGLGERVSTDLFLDKDDGVYSAWAFDNGMPIEDGRPPGKNTYGVHPFYMFRNNENTWGGVFTNLAAAQDWYVKNYKDQG